MKTDGPQRSLHEGSDLSWKVPGEQKAHPLHRGRVASRKLPFKGQVWVWTVRAVESSRCGQGSAIRPPLTGPAGTRTQGPCLSPSPPGRLD